MSGLVSKLLVLVAVAAVILSGCSGKQETTVMSGSTTGETQQPVATKIVGATETATENMEISLSGDAKELDEMVRPILVEVFGGAKPVSTYTSTTPAGTGIYVAYEVAREVIAEDYDKLKAGCKKLGFTQEMSAMSSGSGDNTIGIVLLNSDNTKMLAIGADIGSKEVVATLTKISQ